MNNDDPIEEDPIIAEVRLAREQYAAQFDYDLAAIFEDIKKQQDIGGQNYVALPPRRPESWQTPAKKAG